MLIGFLTTLFVVICLMLIILILIQKGKNSTGLGGLGGSAQALFGASGGQDMFQKVTWILVAIFLFGSLGLAIYKTRLFNAAMPSQQQQFPTELPGQFPVEE